MSDTYLGVVFVCTCCRQRMSECACPCDGLGCQNRIAQPVERAEVADGTA